MAADLVFLIVSRVRYPESYLEVRSSEPVRVNEIAATETLIN